MRMIDVEGFRRGRYCLMSFRFEDILSVQADACYRHQAHDRDPDVRLFTNRARRGCWSFFFS